MEKCAMGPRNKGLEPSYKVKCILRLSALGAATVSALLFSLAFFLHFEPEFTLFKAGRSLIYISETVTLAFSAVLSLLTFILIPKRELPTRVFPSEAEYKPYYRVEPMPLKISRYLTAAFLLLQGAVRAYLTLSGRLASFISPFFAALMLLLTVPLALYFLPELTDKVAPEYKKTHLVCGTLGLLWFFLNVINIYFDTTVALASPYRMLTQLAFLLVMLMILYEIKLHTAFPFVRARLASLLAAFVTVSGFTVGRIVMLLCGKAVSADDTALVFVFVGFSLYMGARLFYYNED